ncbi:MAG: DUF1295 domain-containing protein [Gammaproteobacteria bacterium AqS3]|nr:DUF1295 domain-containing protein [Gammaproteobacteria bacterium AqS3]
MRDAQSTGPALKPWQTILGTLSAALAGALLAWAGSDNSASALGDIPLFALCVAGAFAIQWLAYIPAQLLKSERFFDLTGAATYILALGTALLLAAEWDLRRVVLFALVTIWAVRLGGFLFVRIQQSGGDGRFDRIKLSAPWFLMAWTLQGLWVSLTAACALAAITSMHSEAPDISLGLGVILWAAGFLIEVAADRQKAHFNARPENTGAFIRTGLWAWSRHPNYFGEILLWFGIAVAAAPALGGFQLICLISPLYVSLQLTRISGINMLTARGLKKWGDEPAYREYLAETPALIPAAPKHRTAPS